MSTELVPSQFVGGFNFLNLPGELRQQVYLYLLQGLIFELDPTPLSVKKANKAVGECLQVTMINHDRPNHETAILLACRTTFSEAMPLLYRCAEYMINVYSWPLKRMNFHYWARENTKRLHGIKIRNAHRDSERIIPFEHTVKSTRWLRVLTKFTKLDILSLAPDHVIHCFPLRHTILRESEVVTIAEKQARVTQSMKIAIAAQSVQIYTIVAISIKTGVASLDYGTGFREEWRDYLVNLTSGHAARILKFFIDTNKVTHYSSRKTIFHPKEKTLYVHHDHSCYNRLIVHAIQEWEKAKDILTNDTW